MKKGVDQEKERDLQNNIQSLETRKLTEDDEGKLESYKQELIALREKKMEGVLLRSRARWVAESENKIEQNIFVHLKNVITLVNKWLGLL